MADSSVFNELPNLKNFTDKVNSKIEVEGQQYNFEDMIENEYISDFPKYSHRMRSNFVEIVRYTDLFFNKTRDGLLRIENNVNATIQNALATDTKNGLINFNKIRELSTTVLQGNLASDSTNGIISFNKVKELSLAKMQEFGLGLTTTSTGHINDYRPNGFYAFGWQGGGIGNKTTGVFNIQYADRYGVQLSITQEDKTRAFIRAKNNGSWTSHKELMQVDDFNLYANAYLGNNEVKVLSGRNAVEVRENDILVYDTNNKRYYYKSKINGNITIPTEENTEKLMLGSDMGFEQLKKKLSTGTV
jgi:hypothetical protein